MKSSAAMSKTTLNLTTDPLPRLVVAIAIPSALGMLFNTLFNVADMVFAGGLGTEAVAALSISFPLYFLITALGSGLSQGATALIAHELGAGSTDKARRIFQQAVLLSIVVGVLLALCGVLAAPAALRFLGAAESYHSQAVLFMRVIFGGSPFFTLVMTLNSFLSASGRNTPYRNVLILGFFANCALNPILMWGLLGLPAMGVGGLALATVLVQIGGCLYLGIIILKHFKSHGADHEGWTPDFFEQEKILRQAIPTMLNMISIACGVFILTWFVKSFGTEAIAAMGLGTRIEQIVLLPAIGISSAMLSLTGQNLGAGLPHRIRSAWLLCLKFSVSLMVAGGLVLVVFSEPLFRLFTKDPLVISHGREYLFVSSLTLAAYPVLFSTVFMMQGLKKPAYGLLMGLYRQILGPIFVLGLLIGHFQLGLPWIWWGFSIVTWSAACIALLIGFATLRQIIVSQ
ncbi:MAG: MATE family efflux transporter [bacterium]